MASPIYFIGPELPGPLSDKINALKGITIKKCGYQMESNVIPHITMNLNRFFDVKDVEEAITSICLNQRPIAVSVDGVKTFQRKKTEIAIVYVAPEKNPLLNQLQRIVCEKVAPFRDGHALLEPGAAQGVHFTGKQIRTAKKYGYPFVGNAWIPHITIAFLLPDCFQKIGEELLNVRIKGNFLINKLILYQWSAIANNWVKYKYF